MRHRLALAVLPLLLATAAYADDEDGNLVLTAESNAAAPELSEEARVFSGEEPANPLAPHPSFSARVDTAIKDARDFASFMGPETWAILIGGFALVGYAIRRSERVLNFDTERASRRTIPPEDRSAGSAPDASTPPHSDSDPAPSARRDPVE
jgi:hypothetical protein